MQYLLFVTLLLVSCCYVFAGRAFPIDSENWVQDHFALSNPQIEWDVTNFLVDLSGQYAICKNKDKFGTLNVDRRTPEGESIGALIESTLGRDSHVDAVNQYIKHALPNWTSREYLRQPFLSQITYARKFGCSVQPGCGGFAVIACLFSPAYVSEDPWEPPKGDLVAKAFTKEQYALTEKITGRLWDPSHLLENLSGLETSCSMIGKSTQNWVFTKADREAEKRGYPPGSVVGEMGYKENDGTTEGPMTNILRGFRQDKLKGRELGCSVIPDCVHTDRKMYVVVSCLTILD